MHFRLDDSRCTPDYAYSTSSRCTSDSMIVDVLPTTLTRHRYDALSTRRYPSAKTTLKTYAKLATRRTPESPVLFVKLATRRTPESPVLFVKLSTTIRTRSFRL